MLLRHGRIAYVFLYAGGKRVEVAWCGSGGRQHKCEGEQAGTDGAIQYGESHILSDKAVFVLNLSGNHGGDVLCRRTAPQGRFAEEARYVCRHTVDVGLVVAFEVEVKGRRYPRSSRI